MVTPSESFESADKKMIKSIEKLGCRFKKFGSIYHKVFYEDVIEKELELAELKSDADIIVVGCGPFPMTVQNLAEKGFNVTGLDRDPSAIRHSKEMLADVEFILDDGRNIDYSDYDAVWIPFHVEPKDDILCNIFKEIKLGGKVVYRVPKNHLKCFYRSVDPSAYTKKHCCVDQSMGKRSIVAVKEKKCRQNCYESKRSPISCRSLKTVKIGEEAKVLSCPKHSCLNALGIREGKRVKMKSRQPLGGPLLVSVEGREAAIDRDIAGNIAVA